MGKKGKKVNLEEIDLERMADMAAENPGTLTFPHTAGSALIKPEDKGKIKGRSLSAMYEQTDMDLKQIYEQMQLLASQANTIKQRVEVSERIYEAAMGFEPIIGKTYHLYTKADGSDILSLVGPEEWGRSMPFTSFVATARLMADHTWDVIKENRENY